MSKGLRHVFAPNRFNAAEGVLGGVALVLVVWLLWPESTEPKLDQKATWQQHLKEAERRRAATLVANRPVVKAETAVDRQDGLNNDELNNDDQNDDNLNSDDPNSLAKPAVKRRVLAKPSELADRYGAYDQQPAAMPLARGGQIELPGAVDLAVKESKDLSKESLEVAGTELLGEASTEPVDAVRADKTVALLAPDIPNTEAGEPETGSDEPPADIEIAVYSTESLDAEINPDRLPDDLDAAPSAALSRPSEFNVESSPSAHVRQRPRDDAPSWLKNSVAASLVDDRPVIAVVMDDLGLNRGNTKALNDLPGPLTLAFLPYAGKIEAQTEAARLAGHELMVHLPMEPFGSQWPGPEALVTSLDHDEFVKRLESNLNRIEGYVGVNNHMGSRLTSDRGRMDVLMRELRRRDVLFLDSVTSPGSVAGEMASRNGVPNTIRDIFLDHVIDIGKIRAQMRLVERIARRSGSAVAIGHPHSATIEALKGWLPSLASRGFTIAPISTVVARRACNRGLLIAPETCGQYLQAQKADVPTFVAGGG